MTHAATAMRLLAAVTVMAGLLSACGGDREVRTTTTERTTTTHALDGSSASVTHTTRETEY